jgi:hypothetical protein
VPLGTELPGAAPVVDPGPPTLPALPALPELPAPLLLPLPLEPPLCASADAAPSVIKVPTSIAIVRDIMALPSLEANESMRGPFRTVAHRSNATALQTRDARRNCILARRFLPQREWTGAAMSATNPKEGPGARK